MTKEKELHAKIQTLRNEFAVYIEELKKIENNIIRIQKYDTLINNKFVEILMLNELLHKEQ